MTEEMKEPSPEDFEAFIIYYVTIETTYGLLLVVFQNRQICKLELGASERELLESLELSFPPLYYIHSPADLATGDNATAFHQHISTVVEALENPSGKVLDVPLSFPHQSLEVVT